MCSRKRGICDDDECLNCFGRSMASHKSAEFWSKKNTVSPRRVCRSCGVTKYWFDCDKCFHSFEALPSNITREKGGTWCPYCYNSICDDPDCSQCYKKSFASSRLAGLWSDKNKLTARQVSNYSIKKEILFNCPECLHEFLSSTASMNKTEKNGCPFCNKKARCTDENCDKCFESSFASHPRAVDWSKRNSVSPREISYCTGDKYWIYCKGCKHDTYIKISRLSTNEDFCPYCGGHDLCKEKGCIFCHYKSFQSHEKAKYWSPKNKLSPRQVCLNSNNKFIFDCPKCNQEFEPTLSSVAQGSWCSFCFNKTERKLYEFLTSLNRFDIKQQFKIPSCRSETTGRYYPFDFCLDNKVIIELDGNQHFHQVSNWQDPEETLQRDIFKVRKAAEEGYNIIRIFQEDVLFDREKWQKRLLRKINKFLTDKYTGYFSCIKGSQSYTEMKNLIESS